VAWMVPGASDFDKLTLAEQQEHLRRSSAAAEKSLIARYGPNAVKMLRERDEAEAEKYWD